MGLPDVNQTEGLGPFWNAERMHAAGSVVRYRENVAPSKEDRVMFGVGRRAAVIVTTAIFGTALLGGAALAAFAPVESASDIVAGADANAPERGDRLKGLLDALVKKNVITQAQEDAILGALKDAKPDRAQELFLGRVVQELFAQSASYLGTNAQDLRAKLPGTSLGAIADATPGKSKAGLVESLTAFANDAIAKALANGKLTTVQADKAKTLAPAQITKLVERTYPTKQPRPAAPQVQRPSGTKPPRATP